jgi:hypothetical protein
MATLRDQAEQSVIEVGLSSPAEQEGSVSEVFTVFFSWQSDTRRQHNRDLIREALEAAADAISRDTANPYRILIQSDTEGEPGLCNIPATILRRLRDSDAIVCDLTFVARTEGEDPKHCSNPNVLFELGYAFASVGPERIICVMNEAHGPAAQQIFDLAHHRRPIGFTSPNEGTTRVQTIAVLAKELEPALRGVVELGLIGGYGGDDEILHQRHLSEIQATFRSTRAYQADYPRVEIVFRPSLFRTKRWSDAWSLEDLLRRIGPHTDRFHHYPPLQKGTAPMDWGIYNDTYGDPWAMTYPGQFWAEFMVGSRVAMTLSELDARVSPEPPESLFLPEGGWVPADIALPEVSTAFQVARNLSREFGDSERVQLELCARNIRGRWLHVDPLGTMGPCRATTFQRKIETTAADFRKNWLEHFATIGKDFCDLFCRDGRVLNHSDVKEYQNLAGNY